MTVWGHVHHLGEQLWPLTAVAKASLTVAGTVLSVVVAVGESVASVGAGLAGLAVVLVVLVRDRRSEEQIRAELRHDRDLAERRSIAYANALLRAGLQVPELDEAQLPD